MDYYAPPPAITRPAQQERVPSCESIAKKSHEWGVPEYSFSAKTSQDVLRYFREAKTLQLEDTVDDMADGIFTMTMKKPISLGYYKAASSKRNWDLVLNYQTDVKRPFSAYVAFGRMTDSGLLSTHDWSINFKGETEIVKGKNYDFEKLINRIPEFIVYTCNVGLRFYLDHLLWLQKR